MAIHKSTKGHEGGARDYVAGRPSYPPEAAAWLADALKVGPGRRTLEVGAGTGKFLPLLASCGGAIRCRSPLPI